MGQLSWHRRQYVFFMRIDRQIQDGEKDGTMHLCNQVVSHAKAAIELENGEQLALEYSLRYFTGPEEEALYGLRVDKRTTQGQLVEREETSAITASLEVAKALAEAFAAGTVTPCVLQEMVHEWLGPFCQKVLEQPLNK